MDDLPKPPAIPTFIHGRHGAAASVTSGAIIRRAQRRIRIFVVLRLDADGGRTSPARESCGGQVTKQVTPSPDKARPGQTSSDIAPGLACGNRIQHDALRQSRAAWHAEGQGRGR